MKEPSVSRKIAVIAGFFVSFAAALWLLSFQPHSFDVIPRIGLVSAVLCSLAILVFCWSASVAYFARKRKWSPRACYMAGLSFVGPMVLLQLLGHSQSRIVMFLTTWSIFWPSYLTRKLAYPELTDEEAAAPEPPLSLFPKRRTRSSESTRFRAVTLLQLNLREEVAPNREQNRRQDTEHDEVRRHAKRVRVAQ
jgi:hypothetical protein